MTYISDVLFHMDDIQKIRSAEEYLRQGVSGTFETSIQEAIDMSRSGNTEDRIAGTQNIYVRCSSTRL